MKRVGFLLLPAGWVIVLAALVMFEQPVSRDIFVLAGVSIQAMGMALIFHRTRNRKTTSR